MKENQAYIIAEAGVNHNGSVELAKKLIDAAAKAGADAVKFQTFKAETLVSASAPMADYQRMATNATESQFDMLRKLELDEAVHQILVNHCKDQNIEFLSTPFDEESVDMLAKRIDVPLLKIPSGEITNGPLLLKAAQTKKPIILSTGMSTLAEIRTALGVLAFGYSIGSGNQKPSLTAFKESYKSKSGQRALKKNVVLLHCTTEYPADFNSINLYAMDTMREAFGLQVGLSDHSQGIAVAIAATARGASIIEKHFTLDHNLPGPDHQASLLPDELCQLVRSIREVEMSLGSAKKVPAQSEIKNLVIARRSLIALKETPQGELLTKYNLGYKRPGSGISPMKYWKTLGKKASKNYHIDEMIEV